MPNGQSTQTDFFIWTGVYSDFSSAKNVGKGAGFSSEQYNTQTARATNDAYALQSSGATIPMPYKQRFTLFPTIVSLMLRSRSSAEQKLRILDYGGGFGMGLLCLMEAIPRITNEISYTVVELPTVCDAAKLFWKDRNIEIQFEANLERAHTPDIVFCSSVIQYIEKWKEFVSDLSAKAPTYILLSDVFCGKIESFVSNQNYYESVIPHWFLNESELISEFKKNGYSLLSQTHATGKRAGIHDEVPMGNFPESRRIQYTQHLLFGRQ
jgi:putative methyltransferase (TIGR04325 family)